MSLPEASSVIVEPRGAQLVWEPGVEQMRCADCGERTQLYSGTLVTCGWELNHVGGDLYQPRIYTQAGTWCDLGLWLGCQQRILHLDNLTVYALQAKRSEPDAQGRVIWSVPANACRVLPPEPPKSNIPGFVIAKAPVQE